MWSNCRTFSDNFIEASKFNNEGVFSYRIMDRKDKADTILHFSTLFHQFLVDGWKMIEFERLIFISRNKNILRDEKYVNLQGAISIFNGPSNITSRCIILPSIYPESPRLVTEIYHDAIGI